MAGRMCGLPAKEAFESSMTIELVLYPLRVLSALCLSLSITSSMLRAIPRKVSKVAFNLTISSFDCRSCLVQCNLFKYRIYEMEIIVPRHGLIPRSRVQIQVHIDHSFSALRRLRALSMGKMNAGTCTMNKTSGSRHCPKSTFSEFHWRVSISAYLAQARALV